MKILAVLLSVVSMTVCAQVRPVPTELAGKNITVIVPFGPGGNTDITARQLAKTVEQLTGLNVVISNRPGANGTIATQSLVQSDPNGLTLGQLDTGPSMVNSIQGLPNTHSKDQLTPVSASIESSLALIVNANTSANTVQEFVAQLKQVPRLNYATVGSIQTLMTEALLETAQVKGAQAIVYKSQAETLRSVAANDTAFVLAAIGDAQGLIDANKLKVLAVGSRARLQQVPTIPTLAETYPGMITVNYNGVFAPKHTPKHILEYLNWAWSSAVREADTANNIIKRGNVPIGGDLAKAEYFYASYYDNRERLYKKYKHLVQN